MTMRWPASETVASDSGEVEFLPPSSTTSLSTTQHTQRVPVRLTPRKFAEHHANIYSVKEWLKTNLQITNNESWKRDFKVQQRGQVNDCSAVQNCG